jgi:hypothetical protein
MIAPPRKGEPFPGPVPPLRVQWARTSPVFRVAVIAGPLVVVVILLLLNVTAGVTAAVLVIGVAAASVMFVKNRSDRHNAAIDRGEVPVPGDPHLRPASPDELPPPLVDALSGRGFSPDQVGRVVRFDGGWLVHPRGPRQVAVVAGDDGGWARYEPRRVTDLWAAMEYEAGRGLEPDQLYDRRPD